MIDMCYMQHGLTLQTLSQKECLLHEALHERAQIVRFHLYITCNRKNESMLVKIRSVVAWKGWVVAEGLIGKGNKEIC